jgi:hypothetical protein
VAEGDPGEAAVARRQLRQVGRDRIVDAADAPLGMAMPTSADRNDFATENEVTTVSRAAPLKYRS